MPLTSVFNKQRQNRGTTYANRDTGGALQVGETYNETNVSPAAGVVPGAITGDFRAGAPHPASVLGTGANPDRLVNGTEAV